MNHKLLVTLTLAVLVVIFVVQNVTVVEVQFLIWSTRAPRSLLMLLVLSVGIIMGWFLHSYHTSRNRK